MAAGLFGRDRALGECIRMWVVGFVRPFGAGGCGMGFPGFRTLARASPGALFVEPGGVGVLTLRSRGVCDRLEAGAGGGLGSGIAFGDRRQDGGAPGDLGVG